MGNLSILDAKGDIKIKWDADNREEIKLAEKAFDDAKAKRFTAFKMEGRVKGSIMKKFDKNAESILMTPPMLGG